MTSTRWLWSSVVVAGSSFVTHHLIHRIVLITLAAAAAACSGAATPVEPGPVTPPSPPRFSIQGALDAAANEAVIVVPSGDYAESVRIGTPGVILRAARGVTLDGGVSGGVGISIEAPDVEVSGFTIRGFTVAVMSQGARWHRRQHRRGHATFV